MQGAEDEIKKAVRETTHRSAPQRKGSISKQTLNRYALVLTLEKKSIHQFDTIDLTNKDTNRVHQLCYILYKEKY